MLSKYKNSINVNVQDEHGQTAFMHAAFENHVEIMKLLLNTGKIDVQAKNDKKATALMKAVSNSSIDVIKFLLSDEITVESKAEQLEIDAAFAYAAAFKNDRGLDGMKYLLENENANINSVDKDGNTALINAARSNSKEILNFLLSKKDEIDVNFRNKNSPGPLTVY